MQNIIRNILMILLEMFIEYDISMYILAGIHALCWLFGYCATTGL